jgi:hypothetical protein
MQKLLGICGYNLATNTSGRNHLTYFKNTNNGDITMILEPLSEYKFKNFVKLI